MDYEIIFLGIRDSLGIMSKTIGIFICRVTFNLLPANCCFLLQKVKKFSLIRLFPQLTFNDYLITKLSTRRNLEIYFSSLLLIFTCLWQFSPIVQLTRLKGIWGAALDSQKNLWKGSSLEQVRFSIISHLFSSCTWQMAHSSNVKINIPRGCSVRVCLR